MSFYDRIQDKEKLKKDFLSITFFVTLYENFKSRWKEEVIAFYSSGYHYENENIKHHFMVENPDNPTELIKDKEAEKKFNDEVYHLVPKENGGYDREASLFKWLLNNELIQLKHYDKLLEIRRLRNKVVHELDFLLDEDEPLNFTDEIKDLIEIRKYASKEWFLNFELPTDPDAELNDDGTLKIPDQVYSTIDLSYDYLYDILFK